MDQKNVISIVDLFIELKNRLTSIVIVSILFSMIGVAYTNSQKASYTAKFYAYLNHPAINNQIVNSSYGIEKWLNESKNTSFMPKLELKQDVFTVISNNPKLVDNTKERFRASVMDHLMKVKQTAVKIKSDSSNRQFIEGVPINYNNQTSYSIDSLSELDVDDIMKRLSFSFIIEKRSHPNNYKYSVLGFGIGLLLSALFILMKFSLKRDD